MLISLFTDASFCPDTKVGGWGAWSRCELGKCEAGGAMKRELHSSNEAEARAVYAGLLMLKKERVYWLDRCTRILIQLDNAGVIDAIHQKNKENKTLQPRRLKFVEAILKFEQDHSLIIMGKHIKGHSASKSKGSWVNNQTDKLAKLGLVEARAWHAQSAISGTQTELPL